MAYCDKCRALARQESDIPTGLARELEMSEENPFEEERAWRSMALPGKYLYNQIDQGIIIRETVTDRFLMLLILLQDLRGMAGDAP